MEWNAARLKFPVLAGVQGGGSAAEKSGAKAAFPLAGLSLRDLCRIGFAFTWPLAAVALLALVVFLLFTALVLPAQSAQAEAQFAGVGSPDTSFWYTPDDLYRMAEAYGAQGRPAYNRARFTFDIAWPLV